MNVQQSGGQTTPQQGQSMSQQNLNQIVSDISAFSFVFPYVLCHFTKSESEIGFEKRCASSIAGLPGKPKTYPRDFLFNRGEM